MGEFAIRVVFVYVVLLVATRIMGKREIGQLSAIDFVVAIVVAELATMPITNLQLSILDSVIPIGIITLLQVITSILCLKSNYFRRLVYGRPNILIANGQMQLKEMRKARYNIDDLLTQLRQRDVFDVADVDYAVLETSGDLTVSLKAKHRAVTVNDLQLSIDSQGGLALTLIDDGEINLKGLEEADLDVAWLMKRLRRRGIHEVKEVFFASLSNDGSIYLMKKEEMDTGKKEQEIH